MSVDIASSTVALAAETLVEVAWAQWSGLTAAAATGAYQPRVWTIIDPEALVLVSLAVRDRERRLNDLLAAFARTSSSLLSTQRLKSLAKGYPETVREQIPEFGRWASEAGDRRWRSFAADQKATTREHPREKDLGPLRLTEGPGLMLRLRAGIGVSAKADLLTFLLGLNGAGADLKTITLATAYSNRALRTAAEEMAIAHFIHEIAGPPTAYRADPKAWGEVLQAHPPATRSPTSKRAPSWRFWSVAFSFLTAVIHWELQSRQEEWSSYVASSRARDLIDDYRRQLRLIDAEMGSVRDIRGTAYLDSFQAEVNQICGWALRSLRE